MQEVPFRFHLQLSLPNSNCLLIIVEMTSQVFYPAPTTFSKLQVLVTWMLRMISPALLGTFVGHN